MEGIFLKWHRFKYPWITEFFNLPKSLMKMNNDSKPKNFKSGQCWDSIVVIYVSCDLVGHARSQRMQSLCPMSHPWWSRGSVFQMDAKIFRINPSQSRSSSLCRIDDYPPACRIEQGLIVSYSHFDKFTCRARKRNVPNWKKIVIIWKKS